MKTNPTNFRPAIKTILAELKKNGSRRNIEGMSRYGIVSPKAFGVGAVQLRSLARKIGTDHRFALDLWKTGWYEARMLAAFVADPIRLDEHTMNRWVRDFDNWAITDGLCIHLFRKTRTAHSLVVRWTKGNEEFVRRAGFTMIATLAVHDKEARDEIFTRYLGLVERYANDDRTGVKKAVNWALRQIGKRNRSLYRVALLTAQRLSRSTERSARWIGHDALREFRSPAVLQRLNRQ